MTDLDVNAPAEKKPKRPYHRRKPWRRRKAAGLPLAKAPRLPKEPPARDVLAELLEGKSVAPIEDSDWITGLDAVACAIACNTEGCAITGGVCGHPNKGGLQHTYQQDKDILARFKRVQLHLHHLAAEAKKG